MRRVLLDFENQSGNAHRVEEKESRLAGAGSLLDRTNEET